LIENAGNKIREFGVDIGVCALFLDALQRRGPDLILGIG